MKRKRFGRFVLPIVMTASLLAGCGIGAGDSKKNAEPATLKVMYWDERSFFDQYGMLFSAIHPEVEIEVVSTQSIRFEPGKDMDAEMLKLIDEKKPDVVMLSPEQYTKMADQGKLLELETKVEDKSFDKAGLIPGVLDYLKDLSGGGKLYGLVPSFYSQAIYYNKDLFNKHGVELPKDKMTWEDLFRLAAMFPTTGSKEERVYGLHMGYMGSDLYQLASMIGTTQNLNIVDANFEQVTINSDAWKKVFETALTAWKSGTLYTEERNFGNGPMNYEDYLLQEPLISGKVAMAINGTYMMDQIKQAQESTVKDKAIKNWDLVTMPVDPANPDASPYVNFSNIFAISVNSSQSETAWTFLNYIMSEDFARVTSKRQMGDLSVRSKYLADKDGHHFEAFSMLKPIQPAIYKNYQKLPSDFMNQFQGMASQEIQAAIDGKPIADVLNSLQGKAQEALLLAKKQQAEKKGDTGDTASSSASSGVVVMESSK